MVDLAQYDGLIEAQEAGTEVDIRDPQGKPLNWRITIVGPDSKRGRAFQREMIESLREKQSTAELTQSEEEEFDLRRAARCTVAWTPVILGGSELVCSEDNAASVYRRFPFIFDQIRYRVQGRASFMPRSADSFAGRSETEAKEGEQESQ